MSPYHQLVRPCQPMRVMAAQRKASQIRIHAIQKQDLRPCAAPAGRTNHFPGSSIDIDKKKSSMTLKSAGKSTDRDRT
jgi:hypothetical protein